MLDHSNGLQNCTNAFMQLFSPTKVTARVKTTHQSPHDYVRETPKSLLNEPISMYIWLNQICDVHCHGHLLINDHNRKLALSVNPNQTVCLSIDVDHFVSRTSVLFCPIYYMHAYCICIYNIHVPDAVQSRGPSPSGYTTTWRRMARRWSRVLLSGPRAGATCPGRRHSNHGPTRRRSLSGRRPVLQPAQWPDRTRCRRAAATWRRRQTAMHQRSARAARAQSTPRFKFFVVLGPDRRGISGPAQPAITEQHTTPKHVKHFRHSQRLRSHSTYLLRLCEHSKYSLQPYSIVTARS